MPSGNMEGTSKMMKFGDLGSIFLTGVTLLVTCTSAGASVASGGRITAYFVDEAGLVLFDTDGSRTQKPACAHPEKNNFAFRADTLQSQAMFASIVTAYSTGRTVIIGGRSVCAPNLDVENAGNVILQ